MTRAILDHKKNSSSIKNRIQDQLTIDQIDMDLSSYLNNVLDQLSSHIKNTTAGVLINGDQINLVALRGELKDDKVTELFSDLNLLIIIKEYLRNGSTHPLSNTEFDKPQFDYENPWLTTHRSHLYGSWLFLPILLNNNILGFLVLGRSNGDGFSTQDFIIASTYAGIIAMLIEKEHQYIEATRSAQEVQALIGVQQALTRHLELDLVLQLIADEARRLTNSRTALLMLVNGDQLRTVAISGPYSPDVFIGYEIPINSSNTGSSILLRRPVRVEDAWNNPTVYKSDHLQVRSFISVPLIFESKAIGAIMVADKLSGAFCNDDERIASMFASSAVIAVENARLYREEQERRLEADQRRRVAEGLREILSILNSDCPLPEMLYRISRQTCQLLGSDASAISQLQSDSGSLKIQASYGLTEELLSVDFYPIGVKRFEQTFRSGKPIVCTITRDTNGNVSISADDVTDNLGINLSELIYRTVIAVPLFVDTVAYGEMLLYYKDIRNFSDEEIELGVTVGDQVALAIENANLHLQAEDLARLQERQRIAQALHDSVAQMLFSLGMEVEKLQNSSQNDKSMEQSLQSIRRMVSRSSHELRTAIFALREGKSKSGKSGVVNLIEELVTDFRIETGIPITCIAPAIIPNLQPGVTEAIYRIVRESLSNIYKHSKASAVIVNLSHDNHTIHVMIQDDGVGFNQRVNSIEDCEKHLHFGVATMRQLAVQAHGELIIMNGDEQGVLIKANFPIMEE